MSPNSPPPQSTTGTERALRWAGWFAGAAVAAAALIWKWRMQRVGDVLSGASILSGFLFGTLVWVFQLRLRITDDRNVPSFGRLRRFVDLSYSHLTEATAVALATTGVTVFADLTTHPPASQEVSVHQGWTAAIALVGIRLLTLMPMTLWDLHKAYRDVPG